MPDHRDQANPAMISDCIPRAHCPVHARHDHACPFCVRARAARGYPDFPTDADLARARARADLNQTPAAIAREITVPSVSKP